MMNSNFLLLDCGGLNSPANGAVDTTAGTTYGKTATYTCNVGFNVQGDATRLCGADGLWAGNAPICAIQGMYPVSILRKSISGRHRAVRVADGPMTARCRFT